MIHRITCLVEQCANPEFLINTKAGKVVLATGLNLSDLEYNVKSSQATTLIDSISEEIKDMDKNKSNKIKNEINNFLSTQPSINSTFQFIKLDENFDDYIVVKCPCGYKIYVALGRTK